MIRLPWDKYFMVLAKIAALRSGCNSRPTGAVIVQYRRVISTGYNGTIAGQPQCLDRGSQFCLRRSLGRDDKGSKKYQDCPSIHAEQNAINQVSTYGGFPLQGSHIYCTLFPCIVCLKNIASNGITKIYYEMVYESDDPIRDEYWKEKAKEFGIASEKIELTDEEMMFVSSAILKFTSERRL